MAIFTQAGEEVVADAIHAQTACYVGQGTGTGAEAKGNTDLTTPATEARVVGTESQPSADVCQWVATITADGTKTISEVGLFDAAGSGSPPTGGNLVMRALLDVGDRPNVNSGDTVTFTLQGTIA